jgi:hypothetical protein
MRLRRLAIAAGALALVAAASPQDVDRDAYAREYVRFLVLQLDQWSQEFPQQFYAALMRPPVDSSKLSEVAKAGPTELGDSIKRLKALSTANDVLTSAEFRSQLERALASSKEFNQGMSVQRFPGVVQNSWDQLRSTLNNLARVYKLEALAVLEAPAARDGGRGGRGPAPAVGGSAAGGGLVGYIVDLACSKRGKGMWTNAQCIERCVRDGDKIVLVTDEGKVYQISNQDKITAESYGQVVTLTGKTDGDTITVDSLKL